MTKRKPSATPRPRKRRRWPAILLAVVALGLITAQLPPVASIIQRGVRYIDRRFFPDYTFEKGQRQLQRMAAQHADIARVQTIGTSYYGSPIDALVIGADDAPQRILVQGAIHGREYMTAQLMLRQAADLLTLYEGDGAYNGQSVRDMLQTVQVWLIPVSNPDGVRISQQGTAALPGNLKHMADDLLAMNGGRSNFAPWKSNGRGVDLNRNFDANWQPAQGYDSPASTMYAGERPETEPETLALVALQDRCQFDMTISYHSAGEIIFWYMHQEGEAYAEHLAFAEEFAALTGYALIMPGDSDSYHGGFRDWFVQSTGRPGLTIEIGTGASPLPDDMFSTVYEQNRDVVLHLLYKSYTR